MPRSDLTVHVSATRALEKWLDGRFERLPSPDGKRLGTQPLVTNANLLSWQCHVVDNQPGSSLYTVIAVEAHSRYTLLLPYAERPAPERFWVDLVEAWLGHLSELMCEGGFIGDDQHRQIVQGFIDSAAGMNFYRNTDPSVNGHVGDAEQWVRSTLERGGQTQLTPEQAYGLSRHINEMFKTAKSTDGQKERFYPVPRFLSDGLYRFGRGLAEQTFADAPEGDFPCPYTEADANLPPYAPFLQQADRGLPAEDLAFLTRRLRDYASPEAIPTLSALDGFLTGIASTPEPVMPSTWIPLLWGGSDREPEWTSEAEAQRFFGIVIDYMNRIVETLMERPDDFHLVLNESLVEQGGYGVEDWCAGYTLAIAAAREAWETLPDEYMYYLGMINTFGMDELFEDIRQETPESLPGLAHSVPQAARAIHAYSLSQHNAPTPQNTPQPIRTGPKVGRNDPCPCGSGKKYKKCCLH